MSEQSHPVVMCDGQDGMCGVVELDFTLGGIGRIVGSATQLPEGWSGAAPGSLGDDKHYCPRCTRDNATEDAS